MCIIVTKKLFLLPKINNSLKYALIFFLGSSGPYITAVACPVCALAFTSRRELIEHASEHATANDAGFKIPSSIPAARQIRKSLSVARPFKCSFCWKGFKVEDGLIKHMLCHADDSTKPLQCTV